MHDELVGWIALAIGLGLGGPAFVRMCVAHWRAVGEQIAAERAASQEDPGHA